jgi:tRNA(fMet)-specific endonuclease VapC
VKRLLLDTTVLIDADRNAPVTAIVDDDDDVAIAAVTVAELRVGVELATKRYRAAREAFFTAVLESIPVLSYDAEIAISHARLLTAVRKAGKPRGAHDLIIAATALAHDRTIISADPAGFDGLPGVRLLAH